DRVDRGTRDLHGYLWFATYEGVSRFDGVHFTRFGVADGLPAAQAHDILAARDGTIWVASEDGIAWLDPERVTSQPRFQALRAHGTSYALHEDASGTVWAGSDDGLIRLHRYGPVVLPEVVPLGGKPPHIYGITSDPRDGTLYLATWLGLWRRFSDGRVERYRVAPLGERDDRVGHVLVDRTGRLWIIHAGAMMLSFVPRPGERLAPEGQPLWEASTLRYAPTGGGRRYVFEDSHGTIWLGSTHELVTYDATGFHALAPTALPFDHGIAVCVEDLAGNLWLGTDAQGLVRLAPGGFTAFDRGDGLDDGYIHGFVETPGGLVVVTFRDGLLFARFDGARFTSLRPFTVPSMSLGAWNAGQVVVRDHVGAWWYPTMDGIERFAANLPFEALATTPPEWTAAPPALPGRDIARLYEDRHGDVWIATLSATGLARWDRETGRIEVRQDLPAAEAVAFAEDAQGLWIAYDDGHLAHVVAGAPARVIELSPDLSGLLLDRHGRLWVTSLRDGVIRIDDPSTPRLQRYTTATGLASNQAMTVIDDTFDRIYVGTTRGIDRIDPSTGSISHFDIGDGLPNNHVATSARLRDGTLWFGTKGGAARVVPVKAAPVVVPPVAITGVVVGGRPRAVPLAGAHSLDLAFGANDDQLDLAFTTPSFVVGDPVRFQYRLDGAAAWSAPVVEREVHYARLAPGSYHFEVRAVAASGAISAPATVSFVVVPPIWRRGWFLALCVLVVCCAAYAWVRARLVHVLAIERVRTRIATDLHDELGANLSRIAIMSEVVTRRAHAREPLVDQVDDIGRSARELVGVAADIVWSTDPRRDDLGSLIVRLRSFAGDVLDGRDIRWTLSAPPEPELIALGPEQRRHLHMIAKEAIHNAVKHSGAEVVTIAISYEHAVLELSVRDDGRGFDPEACHDGNGLSNMTRRARASGGTFSLTSAPGAGTTIAFRIRRPGA
ncbi:MAG: ATP-binding protein, partial [Deltaproteobacteria bacterium]